MEFDGRGKKWTRDSGVKNSNTYAGYDIKTGSEINIEKRIGSVSTMAEVYLVNSNIACKVLPIDSEESTERNLKEISLAKEASSCRSNYFPKVYISAFCEDTFFYDGKCDFNNSCKIPNFYNKSKRYQDYKLLMDSSSEELKSIILNYKHKFITPEFVREKLNIPIELSEGVTSHLLFSEVAEYDLDYFLDNFSLNENEILELLFDIFKAIRDMHAKLNIVHGDLHLGNILINNGKPLIHDFGKSYKSDFSDINDRQKDIFYFLAQLNDKIELTPRVKKLINDITDIVLDSSNKYPIIEVVKYWCLNI